MVDHVAEEPALAGGAKGLDVARAADGAERAGRKIRLGAGGAALQAKLARRYTFAQLVELIRTGPPRLSVFGVPGADERLNLTEYFVHHEDVRRGLPEWQPRKLTPELSDILWDRLGLARFMLRKAPVGVELVRADSAGPGAAETFPAGNGRVRITAKARTPVVTVTGDSAELTLWTMGRASAADVRLDGNDSDVAALRSTSWRS